MIVFNRSGALAPFLSAARLDCEDCTRGEGSDGGGLIRKERGVRQFSADDQNHKSKLQAAGKRPSFTGGICGLVVTENSKRANLRNI